MISHAGKVLEAVVATNEVASNANVAVAQKAWKEAEQLWVQIRAAPAVTGSATTGAGPPAAVPA